MTGFSMGGFGTWATACQYPDRFAAIAPLAGGGEADQAERLKNIPIWAFHGEKDNVVSLESNQKMVDAVRASGGHAEFTVYPGAGHSICDMTYENPLFYEWLLAKRKSPPQ
jgi:predicted peptidase